MWPRPGWGPRACRGPLAGPAQGSQQMPGGLSPNPLDEAQADGAGGPDRSTAGDGISRPPLPTPRGAREGGQDPRLAWVGGQAPWEQQGRACSVLAPPWLPRQAPRGLGHDRVSRLCSLLAASTRLLLPVSPQHRPPHQAHISVPSKCAENITGLPALLRSVNSCKKKHWSSKRISDNFAGKCSLLGFQSSTGEL